MNYEEFRDQAKGVGRSLWANAIAQIANGESWEDELQTSINEAAYCWSIEEHEELCINVEAESLCIEHQWTEVREAATILEAKQRALYFEAWDIIDAEVEYDILEDLAELMKSYRHTKFGSAERRAWIDRQDENEIAMLAIEWTGAENATYERAVLAKVAGKTKTKRAPCRV